GGAPRALHIGMVVRLNGRGDGIDDQGGHAMTPSAAAKRGLAAAVSYSSTRRSTMAPTGSTARTAPTPCPADQTFFHAFASSCASEKFGRLSSGIFAGS